MGAEYHSASFCLQHGGHVSWREMGHGAGLRLTCAGVAESGRPAVYFRPAGTTRTRAAVPVGRRPPLVHVGSAYIERKRLSGLQGDDSVLVKRASRAMGHGKSL